MDDPYSDRDRCPQQVDAAKMHRISEVTIAHYNRLAKAYRDGTLDHDVSQNYRSLLDAIEGDPPYSILDLGCGPGRDLHHFRSLGLQRSGDMPTAICLTRQSTPGIQTSASQAGFVGLQQRLTIVLGRYPLYCVNHLGLLNWSQQYIDRDSFHTWTELLQCHLYAVGELHTVMMQPRLCARKDDFLFGAHIVSLLHLVGDIKELEPRVIRHAHCNRCVTRRDESNSLAWKAVGFVSLAEPCGPTLICF